MGKELIYITEDDESIRELVYYSLNNEGFEVVSFENAEAMLEALNKRIPSVILLDIMLPGIDGITALKKIRGVYKNINIKIIMLTAKVSEINKVTGLDLGADDYITKPFSLLELTARVKAALRKYTVEISGETLIFSDIKLNLDTREVCVGEENINLTYKEFELLKMLMQSFGSIVSREKLLKDIWGYEYFGETRTLDIHIKNLREKLGKYSDCIITVRGVGYTLKEVL